MKFICLQENLKNALSVVERSVGQNSTLPILSNIFLSVENSQLKISATNLETAVIVWIPSKTEKGGEICVPAKMLSGFVNNLGNGKIEAVLNNENILNIKKDNYKADIVTVDAKNFPIIPKIKSIKKIRLSQKELKKGLGKVLNCVAISDLKPEITGIYFNFKKDGLKVAATDSFRLAEKNINTEGMTGNNFILPSKTSQELSRLLKDSDEDVFLFIDDNQIMFEFDNIQIFSKLIDGQYPNYEQIIPKNFKTKAVIKKQEFLNALKVASIFCGKNNDIKIKVNKDNIEIVSKDSEKGENINELNTKIEGDSLEVVFNYKYLIDGLSNFEDEDIVFGFNEKNMPALILGLKEKGYNYVVMPIRSI